MIGVFATITLLVVVGVVTWNAATHARRDIEVSSFDAISVFANPREGQIAILSGNGSAENVCGLYLSEADGIGVLVFTSPETAGGRRTVLFPLSSAHIEILPGQVMW